MADEIIEYGTHIKFVPGPSKPKTKTWYVVNKYDDASGDFAKAHLGWIGWYAPWRKYCFFPKGDTVYEKVCLREIANFCERKTSEHKAKK